VTNAATPENGTSEVRRAELRVDGMSCGACARRVENELNKLDGVRASVNFSRKVATVDIDDRVETSELCDVIEKAGYGAEVQTVRSSTRDILTPPRQRGPAASVVAVIKFVIRRITLGHLG